MSKLKIGFAGLLMLILVSIFSTAAFAETPVTPDEFVPTSTHPTQGIVGKDGENKGVFVGDKLNDGTSATHRTHGNFQNNTNSCANCHSTHNAAESGYLMMKSTEYDLCMACHDGTMGFYDVVNTNAGAGTFNTSHADASMHDVEAEPVIGSAPGAYANTETGTLECSSCHNPHGSANDRLLKETVLDDQVYAWDWSGILKDSSYGSSVTYTKTTTVAAGTQAIKLMLTEDPDYSELNGVTGGGLKITVSDGPDGDRDRMNYSNFCGTCHDDYLTKRTSGKASNEGKLEADKTYSHTTNSHKGGRNCASCHYAHGTDITTLQDSSGQTVSELMVSKGFDQATAEAYMNDVSANGSSAIKKFTNMSVCFSCHGAEFNGAGVLGQDVTGVPDTTDHYYTDDTGNEWYWDYDGVLKQR